MINTLENIESIIEIKKTKKVLIKEKKDIAKSDSKIKEKIKKTKLKKKVRTLWVRRRKKKLD